MTTAGPFEMIEGEASLECVDGVCLVPEPSAERAEPVDVEAEPALADPA